jgi:hypothetical protein
MMAVSIAERGGNLNARTPHSLFTLHTQGLAVNHPHNVEVVEHGQIFLVNTVVGASDNAPIEITVGWMTGLKP